MVLVEDITDTTGSNQQGSESTRSNASQSGSENSSNSGSSDLVRFVTQDKISAILWLTRIFTVICTFLFVFPVSGYNSTTLFQKALMSSAATSALKLHQRMNNIPFQLNREYFFKLMVEDSFHYLLYALIFLNTFPVTIVLIPVTTFAILHVAVYTKTLLNLLGGPESFKPIKKMVNFVISKDKDMMRFIAVNEIILAPTIFVLIFTGKLGIFVPFIYYRFICMRYQSRRNPYNRVMFYELRLALENYTSQPQCPQIIKNLTQRLIGLVIRFAPTQIG